MMIVQFCTNLFPSHPHIQMHPEFKKYQIFFSFLIYELCEIIIKCIFFNIYDDLKLRSRSFEYIVDSTYVNMMSEFFIRPYIKNMEMRQFYLDFCYEAMFALCR